MRSVIRIAACLALVAASAPAVEPNGVNGLNGPAGKVGSTPLRLSVVPAPEPSIASGQLVALGQRLFAEPALSEPPGTSCASCHAPDQAFTGNHGTRRGVAAGSRPGHFARRNAPSLLYVRYTPPMYMYQDDDAAGPEPRGGLFADGRSDQIRLAVAAPLFDPDEMNLHDGHTVRKRLIATGYSEDFERAFGDVALSDSKAAIDQVGVAIEAYLNSDAMAPFDSRFDDFLRGRATLNDQERRGLQLFKDPDKGNCASCHVFSPTSTKPERSLFTDYGYDAIAAPRNARITRNRDPKRFDLGLCATAEQKRWPDPDQWCGYFKTPSLRNAAIKRSFMHNGVFSDLRDVVAFYATRATEPARWYKTGVKFDDLPESHRANVNVNSVPYNRREGATPALDDRDIDDIVAFLKTLTDRRYQH